MVEGATFVAHVIDSKYRVATTITIFFVFFRIILPFRTFVRLHKMCKTTTTLQPPENLIAVDGVDNGNNNVIHDLSKVYTIMYKILEEQLLVTLKIKVVE